jgi:hypothetical protein
MHITAAHPGTLVTFLAAYLCAAAHAGDSVRRYGEGTPGSGNIAPTLWVNSTPRPGNLGFRLHVERALGGTWGFPYVAANRDDVTVAGIRFLIDPRTASYGGAYFLSGQGNGGGAGNIPLPLPNVPELVNAQLHVQVFTLDDFAPNPFGIAATAGLSVRPTLAAQLLVARSVAGAPDPQTAIDLENNTVVDYDRAQFDDSTGMVYVQHGFAALQLDPPSGRLRAFSTETFPPTWRSNAALSDQGLAQHIVLTPDASRAYVLYTGAPGTSPPIGTYDARIGASFGQPWAGRSLRLENVADPQGMVFTPDSEVAFVASLGAARGGAGSIKRIDVHPTSPTFHQVTGELDFAGRLVTDLAASGDGRTLFVALPALVGPSEIAVIDVATFTPRDMDPGTPGTQNLGAELSVPRTPLPAFLGRLLADPRGQELFAATFGGVARVHVDSDSPHFRRVSNITANISPGQLVVALALSDAADRLYAATTLHVAEFDTAQLVPLRAWAISGANALALR